MDNFDTAPVQLHRQPLDGTVCQTPTCNSEGMLKLLYLGEYNGRFCHEHALMRAKMLPYIASLREVEQQLELAI